MEKAADFPKFKLMLMALAPTPARNGFLLKFGELLLLSLIPIGMLQLFKNMGEVEYTLVNNTPVLSGVLAGLVLLSAVIAYAWNRKGGGERLHYCFQTIAVLYLAFWISTYGAAKILGTQFQPPHYVLDTPIGELNGFWLTWTYYGFSHSMALILGWTQIAGCLLILFRVTRLLGIFILIPVMVNIDLIDHFYKISPLAYYNSLQYTFFLIVLLLIDLPVVKAVLLAYRDKARIHSKWMLLNGLRLAVIVLAFRQISAMKATFTARTRLNGVWQVDSLVHHQRTIIPAASGGTAWSKLYFEWRYGCIFKVEPQQFSGKDLDGDYTVDEKTGMLRIGFPQESKNKEAKPAVDSMRLHYVFKTDSLMEMRGEYKTDALVMYVKRVK